MLDKHFIGKNIGVVGFGQTGRSIISFLEKIKANIFLFDDKVIKSPYYHHIAPFDWSQLDTLIVSPGIHLWWNMHPAVKYARKYLIPIINDIDMFQLNVSGKIIGITGTNGKSTTTALIHHILQSKYKTEIGGNFGTPVLNLPTDSDLYVLELSSYQLESCSILGFDTSILLNITPDHLTRHGGMAGYISSKQKVFANPKYNSTAIFSIDDNNSCHLLDYANYPNIIPISGSTVPNNGIGWYNDNLIDNRYNNFKIICNAIPTLDGNHNRQNISAAYAACISHDIDEETFVERLQSFKGLEHRQELVKTINGVKYINDSKATNADSVEQALLRFENIIWILGGRPKEDGIDSLIPYFNKIKFAYLIGEAAEAWHQLLDQHNLPNQIVFNLESAVQQSHKIATDGDVVLLSPACASFDQFKSFEERGNVFKQLVKELT